jgi:hypothetical protein
MAPIKPFRAAYVMALGMAVMLIAGCNSSTTVNEVPEQAKKALIQRKVDVSPGQAKSSRTGGAPAKNRGSGR